VFFSAAYTETRERGEALWRSTTWVRPLQVCQLAVNTAKYPDPDTAGTYSIYCSGTRDPIAQGVHRPTSLLVIVTTSHASREMQKLTAVLGRERLSQPVVFVDRYLGAELFDKPLREFLSAHHRPVHDLPSLMYYLFGQMLQGIRRWPLTRANLNKSFHPMVPN
jgi:hypothetical protein